MATSSGAWGDPPASGYLSEGPTDVIVREVLAHLPPRLAELVIEVEGRDATGGTDEEKAHDMALAFAGHRAGGFYLEFLRAEAHELVRWYQAAIMRVADALERRDVLSGDAVAALLHDKETPE